MADVDVDRVAYHICITMSLRGIQARSFDPTIVVLDTHVRFPVSESRSFLRDANAYRISAWHSMLDRVLIRSGNSIPGFCPHLRFAPSHQDLSVRFLSESNATDQFAFSTRESVRNGARLFTVH